MKHEIGNVMRCPECRSVGAKVVWISKDEKTIGIQCKRSGQHKKDTVILVEI